MPIKPENRKRYPPDWQQIRREILTRANNECEFCRRPNGVTVYVVDGGWIDPKTGQLTDTRGEDEGCVRMSEWPEGRFVFTVLTVAHLDHQPENNDPENLRALCQRCHLRWDAKHHAAEARKTRRKRGGQEFLFGETS